MVTEEKVLSPQEGLQLISDAIAMTKENIRENSFPFLLWGWIVAMASFSFFLLQHYTGFEFYFLPFPVFGVVGIVATFIYHRRRIATSTISYFTDFFYKMWLVLGISFFAVVVINVSQNNVPFTYTLLIAAIGTTTSGLVMKFTPLVIGGILFFTAAITTVYIADEYKVLIHGVAFILGYLVPGYLLKYAVKLPHV